ncbi:MAG: hypothetical protein MR293_07545, partial [Bacteroidales bacterium]|nr:hypothetical protein [Bacteroidales bacterium]
NYTRQPINASTNQLFQLPINQSTPHIHSTREVSLQQTCQANYPLYAAAGSHCAQCAAGKEKKISRKIDGNAK